MDESKPRLPLGSSDFRNIRESGALYVDKTAFVTEVLADDATVLLLPRPRRFGKTTNLSTLRYFLAKDAADRSSLFADLAVWGSPKARAHFQRYPLIYLTFKDIKKRSYAECRAAVAESLSRLYGEHRYLLESGKLAPEEAAAFLAILERRATDEQYGMALKDLSLHLAQHHRERVVILLDEYDTPLHAAYHRGYYDEAVSFFRDFLSAGLKDNEHLFKGVLTGILRVARESIFSGLNNLAVYSMLSPKFATSFGFTEPEVADLAARYGYTESLDDLRAWYDGYRFGGQKIYNPWSVVSFLSSQRSAFVPYWVNTASDELLRDLLFHAGQGVDEEMGKLLRGEGIRKRVLENVVFRDLVRLPEALWSFLLFTGYLTTSEVQEEGHEVHATLTLPNREVRTVFEDLYGTWLEGGLGGRREVEELAAALLSGNVDGVQERLERLLVESASFFDMSGIQVKLPPEKVYQAFVLGLLVHLQPRYLVRSNRESGHGRYDVMIMPRASGLPGVVIELKVKKKGETLAGALAAAKKQLKEKDYAAELRAQGVATIQLFAISFDGKKVLVGNVSTAAQKPRVSR